MPYEILSGSDYSKSSHGEVELVYNFKLSFDTAIPRNGCFGSSLESVRFGVQKVNFECRKLHLTIAAMPYKAFSGSDCSKSSHSEVELVYNFKLSFDTAIPGNGYFGSSLESVRFGSKKSTLSVENCT